MTPTNDAPVTAEQCDRDFTADILDFIAGLNTFPDAMRHSASCMRQGAKGEAQFRPLTDMLARHRLAALASAPAGVNIKVRQKTPVVADYGDNFLVAQVSADGKTVGIDHPCDAVWSDVDRAQTALRDYINERIAGQDKCPFKPRDAALARPRAAVGEQSREAIEKLIRNYEHRNSMSVCAGNGPSDEAYEDFIAAILALQSPPAKVEGE